MNRFNILLNAIVILPTIGISRHFEINHDCLKQKFFHSTQNRSNNIQSVYLFTLKGLDITSDQSWPQYPENCTTLKLYNNDTPPMAGYAFSMITVIDLARENRAG